MENVIVRQKHWGTKVPTLDSNNHSKAENLLRARIARRVAKLYWEEEPGDGQAGQARRKTTFRKENLADLDWFH